MGASMGMSGTARAQYQLRQTFVFLNKFPVNRAEVMISFVHEKFDEDGNLKDEKTEKRSKN